MKQVININYHGRIIPIEITALDILKSYIESLHRYFEKEEGRDEIINDIENRISELFQERLSTGIICITDIEVNAIIKSVGRPEEFDGENTFQEATEKNDKKESATSNRKILYRDENNKFIAGVCSGLANFLYIDITVVRIVFTLFFGLAIIPYLIMWIIVPSSSIKEIGSVRKKLYRDGEGKVIAGVCGGIAYYFGINAWIPRAVFLLPFLSPSFLWYNLMNMGSGIFIIYIIMWLVIPEAKTTTEKLEMKGEKVDMNSIKNSITEEMNDIKERAKNFSSEAKNIVGAKSASFGSALGSFLKKTIQAVVRTLIFIVKAIVYFILGTTGLALFIALLALGLFAYVAFPMKDFLINNGWQNTFAWGILIFFITIPIIGILTWIIRKIVGIKRQNKFIRIAFVGLWLVGIICLFGLAVTLSTDFKSISSDNTEQIKINNQNSNKLIVAFYTERPVRKNNDNDFRLDEFLNAYEDSIFIQNVTLHIEKARGDSFDLSIQKIANGRNRYSADSTASRVKYNIIQKDSFLLLDKGFAFTRKEKFRNQHVILTVYVPVGKQIRINDGIGIGKNISVKTFSIESNPEYHEWKNEWNSDEDYIMKEDGLYTLDGKPADRWNRKSGTINIHSINNRTDSLKEKRN